LLCPMLVAETLEESCQMAVFDGGCVLWECVELRSVAFGGANADQGGLLVRRKPHDFRDEEGQLTLSRDRGAARMGGGGFASAEEGRSNVLGRELAG
jgi:hypothetical protein